MWRTPSNIPDISSGQLGKEPARYSGDCWTPSPSLSSYFYIQTMTSRWGYSVTQAKILWISWCSRHARMREMAETKPQHQPQVDIHFLIIRPGPSGGSGMTLEPGMTTTTRRVSRMAVAAKTKAMSITVTTTIFGWFRDKFTLLITLVETLFIVTK